MFPTGNEKGDEMTTPKEMGYRTIRTGLGDIMYQPMLPDGDCLWTYSWGGGCWAPADGRYTRPRLYFTKWGARRQTKRELKHRASREWTVVDEEC